MPTPFSQFIKDNYKKEDLIGVEVGVFQGVNAVYLLQDLPIKKLYLIDNYKPYFDGPFKDGIPRYGQEVMNSYYADTLRVTEPHFKKTRIIVQESIWAAQQFPDNYFDFVYIDAGHTYDDTMSDMQAWWPKCKVGGLFGGHDYGTVNGGEVKKAVDDFIKEKGIPIENPAIGMRAGEAMEWSFFKP